MQVSASRRGRNPVPVTPQRLFRAEATRRAKRALFKRNGLPTKRVPVGEGHDLLHALAHLSGLDLLDVINERKIDAPVLMLTERQWC